MNPRLKDYLQTCTPATADQTMLDELRRKMDKAVPEITESIRQREKLAALWVFPLLKSLLPVVVAFLLPTTDTLDHRRVGNGTHRHGLFQEPMEELPAMA